MIFYINPGRADKNIGKAYNDICKYLPDDGWICISDQDALWWPELVLKQIENIIEGQGKDFALLGCVTNRLASSLQRPFPQDFDNMDIKFHRSRAEQLYKENYGKVVEVKKPIAGLMMLFPKSTWNTVKFLERCIWADSAMGKTLMNKRMKVGIMTGVYVMHYYRAHSNTPQTYKKHLL